MTRDHDIQRGLRDRLAALHELWFFHVSLPIRKRILLYFDGLRQAKERLREDGR